LWCGLLLSPQQQWRPGYAGGIIGVSPYSFLRAYRFFRGPLIATPAANDPARNMSIGSREKFQINL
jgi:hypothetical protein